MKIKIVDDLSPEDVAMLQALYSRSAESVDRHLADHRYTGSGKFMEKYYVGYGHKSIGDCGSTTLFIEGVSLLAAKAIQDWPLYSGQETSTRYIDMGSQPIVDPLGTIESRAILDRWMAFYRSNNERVMALVKRAHPMRPEEDGMAYHRAVKARAFDIMRGFLPAGITTQLSWHTNLRQASDHLDWLNAHPLGEVAMIAREMSAHLNDRYPSSGFTGFAGEIVGSERQHWMRARAFEQAYPATNVLSINSSFIGFDSKRLSGFNPTWLTERPRGCVLPHYLSDLGTFTFPMTIDFGSFRDLQRHRNGVIRMPVLEPNSFEPWYMLQLIDDATLYRDALALVDYQRDAIQKLPADDFTRQYYTALGFQVTTQITMALPALVYFLELRSSKTVHPTLRSRVLKLVRAFSEAHPHVKLHVDTDPDDWTVRRGEQTITKREG